MSQLIDPQQETIACGDCDIPLLHYIVTTDSPIEQTISASCPFCGSKSYPTTIRGVFQLGPIGRNEEDKYPTVIEDVDTDDDGNSFIKVKRV